MAQKMSSILLRLGGRSNWCSNWTVAKSYTSLLWNDLMLRSAISIFYAGYTLQSSLVNKFTNQYYCRSLLLPSYVLNGQVSVASRATHNLHWSYKNSSRLGFVEGLIGNATPVHYAWNSRGISAKQLNESVTAASFVDYVTNQLTSSYTHQNKSFQLGLVQGLRHTIKQLHRLNRSTSTLRVVGLKLICKGRWSRTKNQRKQKLAITINKLGLTGLRSHIGFASSYAITKFGACSIKLWLRMSKC